MKIPFCILFAFHRFQPTHKAFKSQNLRNYVCVCTKRIIKKINTFPIGFFIYFCIFTLVISPEMFFFCISSYFWLIGASIYPQVFSWLLGFLVFTHRTHHRQFKLRGHTVVLHPMRRCRVNQSSSLHHGHVISWQQWHLFVRNRGMFADPTFKQGA